MFDDLKENLLRLLVEAEEAGRPLTHKQLGITTRGSTFEDLWASMHIVVEGQENKLSCVVGPKSAYVASKQGKWWLECRDAKLLGKPAPPMPLPAVVYL